MLPPLPVRVRVVVPSFNGAEYLGSCLAALARQSYRSFEVLVVDNGSTDESREIVQRAARSRVLALSTNRGFAGACNAGAAEADSELIAFLNNDAEPERDWLASLVACLDRHPRAASVASKTLRVGDPRILDGAGDSMTRSLKAYRRGFGEPDGDDYSHEEQVFSASGTACLWRADVFRALGGFDESFFAYYEDVDLGFRARSRGYECWYAPRAVVRHVGGGTSPRVSRADARYSMPNRWATAVKNAPVEWLLLNAPVIAFGEFLLWSRILRDGNPVLLGRYLTTVGSSLPRLLRARRAVQRERTASYGRLVAFADRLLPPPRHG